MPKVWFKHTPVVKKHIGKISWQRTDRLTEDFTKILVTFQVKLEVSRYQMD